MQHNLINYKTMEELKEKAIKIIEKKIKTSRFFRNEHNEEAGNLFYDDAIKACSAYSELFSDYDTFYNLLKNK